MAEEVSKAAVIVRMVTHALAAGVTLPLGPPGVVLGPALAVLFDAAAEADRRVWERLDRMVEESTTDAGMSAEQLQEWAGADDQRLSFVRDLVSAALATLDEQKVRALGRVLTDALKDEALLHDRPLIIRTLRDLDPIHVTVLRSMMYDRNPQDPNVPGMKNKGAPTILSTHRWTPEALSEHHPQIGHLLIMNVIATLDQHGLITQDRHTPGVYIPTPYVVPVLNYRHRPDDDH